MRRSILTQKVNFIISAMLIASFGIFATSFILRAAQLDDPISSAVKVAVGQGLGHDN